MIQMRKQKRKARPPITDVAPLDDESLQNIDSALNPNITLLYEFIYGSRRHEIRILLNGLAHVVEQTPSRHEGLAYYQLYQIAHKAWVASLKERGARFKKRMKASLGETLSQAKAGNDKALWMLIEFDKAWLFEPLAQERILRAQSEDDQKFFYSLGEAIKRARGVIEDVRGKRGIKQLMLRRLLRQLKIVGFDFSKNVKNELLAIVDSLREQIPLPEPETPEVMERTIKRMGLKA